MIPSTTNRLLVAEDWKKVYQSFRNADFKSYDFDTLKRTMIAYLRENYPEDFNDYVDSSEYIALIDLIAYLGQNISFRVDLNARENFLETAQRRDSVLRLARLINYNVKRNTPASGMLKILAIQTTDNVFDGVGNNLANEIITWNDPTNANWFEQFVAVLNAAMPKDISFGRPIASGIVDGISTEKYSFNDTAVELPIYSFTKNVNGVQMTFEITGVDFNNTIYEQDPRPGNTLSFVYRNDNRGNASSNTGFFVYFKQGTLTASSFIIDNPVPNEVIGINAANINNTDVWLWQVNQDGSYPDKPWTKVDGLVGTNVIYNSLSQNNRKLYSVVTRLDDQIDLNFADGSFGDLPKGEFNLLYRQSNGLSYSITPEQLRNVSVAIDYVNLQGQPQSIKIFASLQYTVSNASSSESNEQVKVKAPQSYYSQNRMVTGEDYNIVPLIVGNDIIKIKSINRASSGISKYFEMSDITGKYSDVNLFGGDGILYQTENEYKFDYTVNNKNEVKFALNENLNKILNLAEFRSFYLAKYSRPSVIQSNISWVRSTSTTNQTTGYFKANNFPVPAGQFNPTNLKYGTQGSLIKFVAPLKLNPLTPPGTPAQQTYFLPNGQLTFVEDETTVKEKWSKVMTIISDGYNGGKGNLSTGEGPVVLTGNIAQDAIVDQIIPKFVTKLNSDIELSIINLSMSKKNFGLSYNALTQVWNIITDTNIDLQLPFSTQYQNDLSNSNRDSSWMIAFVWSGNKYVVRYRTLEYVFESDKECAFFVEPYKVNYDYLNDSVIKDKITVLGINTQPVSAIGLPIKSDQDWQVDGSFVELDGYQEPKKVKVSFYDRDNDGQLDNPDSFDIIVKPETTSTQTTFRNKFVYFRKLSDGQRYQLADLNLFLAYPTENYVPLESIADGQLFYFYDPLVNVVKKYNKTATTFDLASEYFARPGRSKLKFQYTHKAADNRRIDPSKSNLIDIYMLTKSYDTTFRNWVSSNAGEEPLPPTSQALSLAYSNSLEPIKSVSDELIFHPANYKVLFGSKAITSLQAVFKATRNPSRYISDNELKTRILSSINSFFNIENWDFGQTFYFSELSTYVMNNMTPDITNFVLVPKQNNAFGSLFEIKCQANEIFISSATALDIEIIDSITTSEINAMGTVINSVGGQQ